MIEPELLSPTARAVLAEAGWAPGRDLGAAHVARWRLRYGVAHNGTVADAAAGFWNAAADEFLRAFGDLAVRQSGAGVDLARNSFTLDPLLLVHWVRPLAVRGRALGTVLAPLGRVENGAAVAMADDARLFLIDHTGEWAFTPGIERGLSDLIDGVLPAERFAL